MRHDRLVAAAMAAAFFLDPPGAGARAGEQEKKLPVFGAAVTIVTMPVYVTGKDGQAVGGLAPQDFEIQDEGKQVRIVGFHEVDAGGAGESPKMPSGASPQVVSAARRQFLMLFDLSFTSLSGLVRSRDAAAGFVRKLGPDDLAAVATFSIQSGPKMLVSFTRDRAQVVRAIEGLGVLHLDRKTDPLGLVYELPEPLPTAGIAPRDLPGTEEGAPPGRAAIEEAIQEQIRQVLVLYKASEASVYRRKVQTLFGAMRQLGQMLDALEGRKQIIYLSAGFHERALVGEQSAGDAGKRGEAVVEGRIWEVQSDTHFGDSGVRQELEQMLRGLSSADCVVHTVDVTGLAARGDVTQQGPEEAPGAGRESLSSIAAGTGGRFIRNTNDLGVAFGEILDASRRYYVVAFEPPSLKGPGKFHRLKVKVKGKGGAVSHRAGYTERPPFAAASSFERKLEAAEAIAKKVDGGALGLQAMALALPSVSGAAATLPVVLEVDVPSLLEGNSGDGVGVEIYGYALDETGGVEDVASLSSALDLAKVGDKLRGGGLQIHFSFQLAPGRHDLRFFVRNTQTGRSGSRTLSAVVPAGGDALLLPPPLFVEDRMRWIVLQARSRNTQGLLETPFKIGTTYFAPRPRPQVENGQAEDVLLFAWEGPGRTATYDVYADLLDGSGKAVPSPVQVVRSMPDKEGMRRFLLKMTPEGLTAGDYTLKVRLRDTESGRQGETTQAVRVP